jgi:hypothetical protein
VHFEDESLVESLLDGRLRDLLTAGYITDSIYQAASDSPAVALGIITGYLDTCWEITEHWGEDA